MKRKGRDLMKISGNAKACAAIAFAIICFLMLQGGAALAQPPRAQMEGVMQQIQTLKMWKLTKELDLDEQTAARLFPVMNGFDKQRAEIAYNQRLSMNDLRKAVKNGNEDQMKDAIRRLVSGRAALEQVNEKEIVELGNILTVRQQAKYILFMPRFNRQMRAMIRQARRARMGKGMEEH